MTTFSIITGIVTLLGFFLQIKGLFPNYRRYYSAATFFLFGLTVGGAVFSLTQVTVEISETVSAKNILGFFLFGGTGLLIFLCFTVAALSTDEKRRTEVSKIGSAVSGFLIFMILFQVSSFFPVTPEEKSAYLTYDEQVDCAMSAVKRQNYDRALLLISDCLKSLSPTDPRRENLSKLMDQVRGQQASHPLQLLPSSTSGAN